MAGIVNLDKLHGRRDFLIELGAETLTFARYAAEHVPRALARPDVTIEQKRSVVRLLAERLGEVQDHEGVRQTLIGLAIVECTDGQFRRPDQVYFDTPVVRLVLGSEAALAALPGGSETAVRNLYLWLGVETSPRFEAITRRVKSLTASPPTDALVADIGVLFRHLGDRFEPDVWRDTPLSELKLLVPQPVWIDG